MRLDIAMSVNVGESVFNCFNDYLTVSEKKIFYTDKGKINNIIFVTEDSKGLVHKYDHEDLYVDDMEDESDTEKAWVGWASQNKDFLETFDHIATIRNIYIEGFVEGFKNKLKYSYLEQMQK